MHSPSFPKPPPLRVGPQSRDLKPKPVYGTRSRGAILPKLHMPFLSFPRLYPLPRQFPISRLIAKACSKYPIARCISPKSEYVLPKFPKATPSSLRSPISRKIAKDCSKYPIARCISPKFEYAIPKFPKTVPSARRSPISRKIAKDC